MLKITLVEEKKVFVDVTYEIDDKSIDEDVIKRIKTLMNKGTISDDELQEIYDFCNDSYSRITADDTNSDAEYVPSEFTTYSEEDD